ncbi:MULTISPECIES: cell division protein SepF [Parafrankia]|uniref:Cell division protein SepF n=1 Tax=Parafrankia soli TaxID=2599596 RepID=A0A1S1RIH0_9ACTN|nr:MULTISPECIES: cell division protein SepF [Parafrankia]OHV45032.1 hypothetical protein BBK14_09710 [Parafrankia soli]CAI7980163.1 hypothetical protein FRAHR75_750025 [Frankia sp. Hr75.2]SQD96406.1 hypothetical protein FMEAI12_3640029 [Parafrankia sp. Ea1.12]
MSDDASPDEEALVFEVADYGDAHHAITAYRENGVVIVDYRAADEATQRRVADICTGASLARGFSPFRLATGVYFLTTGRFPTRTERQKFRD